MRLPPPALPLLPPLLLLLLPAVAQAGPTVVPTGEGQIGATPGMEDRVIGPNRFEPLDADGELVFGGIFVAGGAMPPPPEVRFLSDRIHQTPNPVPVGSFPSAYVTVDTVPPASDSRVLFDATGRMIAFAYVVDGSVAQTQSVRAATFDGDGVPIVDIPVVEDLDSFFFPDPTFAQTGVAVDDQGRITVVYSEVSSNVPSLRAARFDGATGTMIDPDFLFTSDVHGSPDAALLDSAGNRLVVAATELTNPATIQGRILDFSGGTPAVLPKFPISTTAADFGNFLPAVAADPATGDFVVAWEHVTAAQGNPVDIRARRFDAAGNPLGNDFLVNDQTANSQGQVAVARGVGGLTAIVWAGDPLTPVEPDDLDVFARVYDADGNPIGGQFQVNTFTDDVQDRPAVRFLPEPDGQGRPQIAAVWRDVGAPDGSSPRGTGVSYRCFAVDGFEEQVPIFEDGFESGDTTSWSSTNPN